MAYRYKKKHYKIKPLPVIIVLLVLVLLIWLLGTIIMTLINSKDNNDKTSSVSSVNVASSSSAVSSDNSSTPSSDLQSSENKNSKDPSSKPESIAESSDISTMTRPSGSKSDWNLILLNSKDENKIDADLELEKTKFDTQWVDSRAAQAYKDMRAAAAKKNITLYLRSGFRSISTQQRNFNNEVSRYINLGNSKEEATRLTKQYYAVPGRSEHHTGLAFDIITPEYHNTTHTLDERFAKTQAYKWLVANCSDYGFILRYPKEKQDVTEINFEPWHYRYVGVKHAKYMTKNKLTLDEYMNLFDN